MPNEQFFSYIMARTSYIRWDDNDVLFVLDQHAKLDFNSVGSLKQQSAGRHVVSLWYNYPVYKPTTLRFLSNDAC